MKYQTTLCSLIFVCHVLLSIALCFVGVGIGMAVGDCAKCTPMPRPQLLDNIDRLIFLLGIPLVPVGKTIAKFTSITEAGKFAIAIFMYMLNGWLLAYCISLGIVKAWQKINLSWARQR